MNMKKLSVAILGLAGFAFAGMAAAACPTGPVPPWSAVTTLGGAVDIVAGGYAGTECRMSSKLITNSGVASAYVRDDTPANEQRYRAQFMVNADVLTGQTLIQGARIFAATTEAPAFDVPDVVALTISGNLAGTVRVLGISTACASDPTHRCSTTQQLVAGTNTIEIDWQKGASGSLRVWINNGVEASPTVVMPVDNGAWGGVDSAVLGLSAATAGFRANQLNRAIGLDQFDSRRTTFIGTP